MAQFSDKMMVETCEVSELKDVLATYMDDPKKLVLPPIEESILSAAFNRARKTLNKYFAPDKYNDLAPVLESLSIFLQIVNLVSKDKIAKEAMQKLVSEEGSPTQKMLFSLMDTYKLEGDEFTIILDNCELYDGLIFTTSKKQSVKITFKTDISSHTVSNLIPASNGSNAYETYSESEEDAEGDEIPRPEWAPPSSEPIECPKKPDVKPQESFEAGGLSLIKHNMYFKPKNDITPKDDDGYGTAQLERLLYPHKVNTALLGTSHWQRNSTDPDESGDYLDMDL